MVTKDYFSVTVCFCLFRCGVCVVKDSTVLPTQFPQHARTKCGISHASWVVWQRSTYQGRSRHRLLWADIELRRAWGKGCNLCGNCSFWTNQVCYLLTVVSWRGRMLRSLHFDPLGQHNNRLCSEVVIVKHYPPPPPVDKEDSLKAGVDFLCLYYGQVQLG